MGIPRHALSRLGRCVGRRGVVHVELQFPEPKDLRVLFLPQVGTKLIGSYRLVVNALDPRLVQQILTLRHEFRRVAGSGDKQDHHQPKTICT